MRILLLSLFAILLAAGLHAQDTLSLEEAMSTALEKNFSVRLVKNQAAIADNNNTIGNAGMLPVLSADGSYFRRVENINQEYANGPPQSRNGALTTVFTAGVQLDYTVFDGFRMFAAKDRLAALDAAASEAMRYEIEATGAAVATAYYSMVRSQQGMEVYSEAVRLSRVKLDLAKTRYDIGSGSKLDYLQARVELNADSNTLILQQTAFRNASYELNMLMGLADSATYRVADTLQLLPGLDIGELNGQALQQNERILQARNNAAANLAAIREAKSQLYPQVALSTRYNFNNQAAQAGFVLVNQTRGLNYGVTARWTIFNGDQTRTRVENAKILAANARIAEEQVTTDVLNQLKRASENYRLGLQQLALNEENLGYARENLEIARERYQIGKSNIIEYRQVQLNYIQARMQLVEAAYTAKAAEVQLLLMSGNIGRIKP